MAIKQTLNSLYAPDGSEYVTLTDGAGNLAGSAVGPGGGSQVEGNVASGVADSGNPVKIGAKVFSAGTAPTYANAQRGDLIAQTTGELRVTLANGTAGVVATAFNSTDAAALGSSLALQTTTNNFSFNGTSSDRLRNNVDTAGLVTLSAASAGTVNGADQTNYNGRGIQVLVDVTVATAMTLTINIQGKDAVSGKYYTILSSAALAAVASTQLTVYPDATVVANVAVSQPLPRVWRVQAVVTGTSVTATVGASVIL